MDLAQPWALSALEHFLPLLAEVDAQLWPNPHKCLGCGAFGCVFSTSTRNLVFKITLDGSEAFAAQAMQSLGKARRGICKYLSVMRISIRGQHVWAFWRQAFTSPTFDTWAYERSQEIRNQEKDIEWSPDETFVAWNKRVLRQAASRRKSEEGVGVDAHDKLRHLHHAGMGIAAAFTVFCNRYDPGSFEDALLANADEASHTFTTSRRGPEWRPRTGNEVEDMVFDAAVDLIQFRSYIASLRSHLLVGVMARALGAMMNEGLVLSDAQPDNVGRVHGVWTLFDCGLCVPIQRKWSRLWKASGADAGVWFGNKKFEIKNRLS